MNKGVSYNGGCGSNDNSALQEAIIFMLQDESIHHEILSLLLFKKILLDNYKVLYLFVKSDMSVDEVKMIEKMIVPEPEVGILANN